MRAEAQLHAAGWVEVLEALEQLGPLLGLLAAQDAAIRAVNGEPEASAGSLR
jgi:hypothetical protein